MKVVEGKKKKSSDNLSATCRAKPWFVTCAIRSNFLFILGNKPEVPHREAGFALFFEGQQELIQLAIMMDENGVKSFPTIPRSSREHFDVIVYPRDGFKI